MGIKPNNNQGQIARNTAYPYTMTKLNENGFEACLSQDTFAIRYKHLCKKTDIDQKKCQICCTTILLIV